MYLDKPKLLGQPEALAARLEQLEEPHIAPLTAFVRNLRADVGRNASIPYFDPWDGGIEAELMFLLEAPGPKAISSGFVSRNNPDETAKNLFELANEVKISRQRSVVWNVVPWYIGTGSKIRPANSSDIWSGIESLACLFELLPRVREVALLGKKAQKAEKQIRQLDPAISITSCAHPSPLFVNRMPGNRQLLRSQLQGIQTRMARA